MSACQQVGPHYFGIRDGPVSGPSGLARSRDVLRRRVVNFDIASSYSPRVVSPYRYNDRSLEMAAESAVRPLTMVILEESGNVLAAQSRDGASMFRLAGQVALADNFVDFPTLQASRLIA